MDDDVVVTTVVQTRPTTLTVTDQVSNFVIATDVSVDHYTITHRNYKIMQSTVTNTVST